MPRRIEHYQQPKLGMTAADLGEEAYRANLADEDGPDQNSHAETAGVVPQWKRPEARNSPPGQYRENAQEVKIGQDWKIHNSPHT